MKVIIDGVEYVPARTVVANEMDIARALVGQFWGEEQIKYWTDIGRLADNPELPVPFIIDSLIALSEVADGKATRREK